jgi:hypothetical protein
MENSDFQFSYLSLVGTVYIHTTHNNTILHNNIEIIYKCFNVIHQHGMWFVSYFSQWYFFSSIRARYGNLFMEHNSLWYYSLYKTYFKRYFIRIWLNLHCFYRKLPRIVGFNIIILKMSIKWKNVLNSSISNYWQIRIKKNYNIWYSLRAA